MNTKQPWTTEQNELLLSLYHTFKYPSGQMNWDRCFGSTDNNDVKLGNRTL